MTIPERMSGAERRTGLARHILHNTQLIEQRMRRQGVEIVPKDPEKDREMRERSNLIYFDDRIRVGKVGGIAHRVSYVEHAGKEIPENTMPSGKKVWKIWTDHKDMGSLLDATLKIRDSYARPTGETAQRIQSVIVGINNVLGRIQVGDVRALEDYLKIQEEMAETRVKTRTDRAIKPALRAIDHGLSTIGKPNSAGHFNASNDEMRALQVLLKAVEERLFGEKVQQKYETLHDEAVGKKEEFEFYLRRARAEALRIGRLPARSPELTRAAQAIDLTVVETLPKIVLQPYLKPALIASLMIHGGPVTGQEVDKLRELGVEDPHMYITQTPIYMMDRKRRSTRADLIREEIDKALTGIN